MCIGVVDTLTDACLHLEQNRAFAALIRYSYPGNVRELENIIERAVIMEQGDTLGRIDLEHPGTGGI